MIETFTTISALMLVGIALRLGFPPLKVLYIPASVVAGLIGLVLMQAALRSGPAEVAYEKYTVILSPAGSQPDAPSTDAPSTVPATNDSEASDSGSSASGVTEDASESATPTLLAHFQKFAAQCNNAWIGWPSLLISVVFAGLLMERSSKPLGQAMGAAGLQGLMVWIIVFGQIALGSLVAALFILPYYKNLPAGFGQLLETGWAGGHGTATAVGEVFYRMDFAAGRDLGFFSATYGLVWGVVSGIVLVNIGVRLGWVRKSGRSPKPEGNSQPAMGQTGSEPRYPAIAFGRIQPEAAEPMALQVALLAMAFAVGQWLQFLLAHLPSLLAASIGTDPASDASVMATVSSSLQGIASFVGDLPLFMFTLFGGLLVREALHWLRLGHWIDPASIKRLSGLAIEFLIIAAMSTLRLETVQQNLVPILILMGTGTAWCIFCFVALSPRILPGKYWFELGLINYGMSTGTTAQGMMLLRLVDEEFESGAADDYALAAPLSAPFVGGGMITLGMPAILASCQQGFGTNGLLLLSILFCLVTAILIGCGWFWRRLAQA